MKRQGAFLVVLGILLVVSILAFSVVFQLLRGDLGQIEPGQSLLSLRSGIGGALSPTSFTFWALLLSPFLAAGTFFWLLRGNRSWRSPTHLLGLFSFVLLLALVLGVVTPRLGPGAEALQDVRESSIKLDGLLERMQGLAGKLLQSMSGMQGYEGLKGTLERLLKELGSTRTDLGKLDIDKLDMDRLGKAFKELASALKDTPEGLGEIDPQTAEELLGLLKELGEEGLLSGTAEMNREELARSLQESISASGEEIPPELLALLGGLAGGMLESGVQVSPEGLNSGTTLSPEGGHEALEVPLFKVWGARYTGYLRQTVADTYDGRVWRDSDPASHRLYEGGALVSVPGAASFQAEVEIALEPIVPFAAGNLFTSLYPDTIEFPGEVFYDPEELTFRSGVGMGAGYSWRSVVLSFPGEVLTSAEVSYDARYLQIPYGISPAIVELAGEVTRGVASPYEKAVAIEEYLKSNYAYDFDYENAPADVEPTYWFLFEEKRGTCANFANAFVILARSVGIPARPVAGFAVAASAQEQVVTAAQAHQWAEVLFDGLGWVTFESTPAGGPSDRAPPSTDPIPSPTPTLEPTPGPTSPPLMPTIIEVAEFGDEARIGEPFTVHGWITTEQGEPVDQMDVEVYLNTAKRPGGTIIGQGVARWGEFSVQATIPPDLPVGVYQVMARAIPNQRYDGSWSDPPLTVMAPTAIEVEPPSAALVGEPVTIWGVLREEVSATPLAGHTIVMAGAEKPVATTQTDNGGRFEFKATSHIRGAEQYEVRFEGTQFYAASSSAVTLEYREPTRLICEFPDEAALGGLIAIEGVLLDGEEVPLPGLGLSLGVDSNPQAAGAVTDGEGRFSGSIAPQEAGGQRVYVRFPAQDYYAPSSAEDMVRVVSSTSMELYLDDRAVVDQPYPLRGVVFDALDNPVSTGKVALVSGAQPLGDVSLDGSEGFLVPYSFPERGRWPVRAQYSGPEFYDQAEAAAELEVFVPTEVSLALPSGVGAREQVVLAGVLTDDKGAGLGGQEVRIQIGTGDNADARTVTTDARGGFSTGYAFSQPGKYDIEASFAGSGLLLPSTASDTLEVRQVSLKPLGESVLVRGESNILVGEVLLGGQPLQGVTVDALLDSAPVGSAQTDVQGRFRIDYPLPETISLGTHGLEYRAARYESVTRLDIEVKARTLISVFALDRVRAGSGLRLKVLLLDDLGTPLGDEVILVEGFDSSARTDTEGVAEWGLSFPRETEPGPRMLLVVYAGRAGLMEARKEHAIQVLPPAVPWGLIASIAGGSLAGVAGAGALGYMGYRNRGRLRFLVGWFQAVAAFLREALRRLRARMLQALRPVRLRQLLSLFPSRPRWRGGFRRPAALFEGVISWLRSLLRRWPRPPERRQVADRQPAAGVEARAAEVAEAMPAKDSAVRDRHRDRRAQRSRIEEPRFPQVPPPFPDVWGVGYPFEVESRLVGDDGSAIGDAPVACEVDGSTAQSARTDDDGGMTFRLRFGTPGEYVLTVVFEGSEEFRPASARRSLRVVDYREEVVRLYHAFLERMRENGVEISREATPREAQEVLRRGGMDEETLESLTWCFEEADYSTHEVARKHYEEAYLAHSRLMEERGP